MSKHLFVGGMVAAGFDKTGGYLLTISHSGWGERKGKGVKRGQVYFIKAKIFKIILPLNCGPRDW